MNKLIEALEQNSFSGDILLNRYGFSSDEHFNCVFVAPIWTPENVFDIDSINIEQVFSKYFATTYIIHHNDKKFIFITLKVGAPHIIDFCLSCYKSKCDKFVFIGSAGSLVPEINIGDIIVPDYAISGNGATLYLHEKMDSKNFLEHTKSDSELNEHIRQVFIQHGKKPLNVPLYSTDTIMAQYLHLNEFTDMGARAIEMESATFFGCMSLINKTASAVIVISDNTTKGEYLIGRKEEHKQIYKNVRKQIGEILLDI